MTEVPARSSRHDLYLGDCLDVMPTLVEESADSVVTDPPYGLSFMGKDWDHGVPGEHFWREALRVAKPGAHLLAFGGTRTFHRLTCAIEDAGWEIRDCLGWLYGSGFPKSMDVGKAIDKKTEAKRIEEPNPYYPCGGGKWCKCDIPTSADRYHHPTRHPALSVSVTDAAHQWHGWGTAIKPAWEPIVLARKPLVGTVVENVLRQGVGAINIDGCKIESDATRRWPANIVHDGSDDVLAVMSEAARFFYCAKASNQDRDDGLQGRETVAVGALNMRSDAHAARTGNLPHPRANHHPTVKPTELMRWLVRLVTPPGGLVLDPFMGSGSTGKAALAEGFRFIGIELNPEYLDIAKDRILGSQGGPP